MRIWGLRFSVGGIDPIFKAIAPLAIMPLVLGIWGLGGGTGNEDEGSGNSDCVLGEHAVAAPVADCQSGQRRQGNFAGSLSLTQLRLTNPPIDSLNALPPGQSFSFNKPKHCDAGRLLAAETQLQGSEFDRILRTRTYANIWLAVRDSGSHRQRLGNGSKPRASTATLGWGRGGHPHSCSLVVISGLPSLFISSSLLFFAFCLPA